MYNPPATSKRDEVKRHAPRPKQTWISHADEWDVMVVHACREWRWRATTSNGYLWDGRSMGPGRIFRVCLVSIDFLLEICRFWLFECDGSGAVWVCVMCVMRRSFSVKKMGFEEFKQHTQNYFFSWFLSSKMSYFMSYKVELCVCGPQCSFYPYCDTCVSNTSLSQLSIAI